jgi:hypothetical protein
VRAFDPRFLLVANGGDAKLTGLLLWFQISFTQLWAPSSAWRSLACAGSVAGGCLRFEGCRGF